MNSLPNWQRWMIFGLGVLMGSMVLVVTKGGKRGAIARQLAEDVSHGYELDGRLLPGQEMSARNPLHVDPGMESYDFEKDENNQFDRWILVRGRYSGGERDLVKERVWSDPDYGHERLVRRQFMSADRVMVRLKEGVRVGELNFQIGKHKRGRVYSVAVPEVKVLGVLEAVSRLEKEWGVEAAFPDYIEFN